MKNTFLFLAAALVVLSSCKEDIATADALNLVPSTATSVTAVRLDQMMEKADFEQVKTMGFYQDLLEDVDDPAIAAILRDPEASGLALEHPLYLVNEINPQDFEESLIVGVATLRDADQFAGILANLPGENASGSGFNYRQVNRQSLVAWTDEAVLAFNTPGYLNLQERATEWLSGEREDKGLTEEKTLREVLGKNADISTWATLNALGSNMQVKMMAGMLNIPAEALQGNYATSFVNFERGQVSGFGYLDFNDDLTKDIRRLVKDEVEADFEEFIPKENLFFAMTAALDARGIDEIFANNPMYRGFADQALSEYGTSTAELLKAFDGDVLFTAHEQPGSKAPMLTFATEIKDRTVFDKLVGLLEGQRLFTRTGENTWTVPQSSMSGTASVQLADDMLFIADDPNHLARLVDGGYGNSDQLDGDAGEWLDDHVAGFYLDFATMFRMFNPDGSAGLRDVKPLADVLDNLVIGVDREESESHLNLKRDDVNSLKALLEMADRMYRENQ